LSAVSGPDWTVISTSLGSTAVAALGIWTGYRVATGQSRTATQQQLRSTSQRVLAAVAAMALTTYELVDKCENIPGDEDRWRTRAIAAWLEKTSAGNLALADAVAELKLMINLDQLSVIDTALENLRDGVNDLVNRAVIGASDVASLRDVTMSIERLAVLRDGFIATLRPIMPPAFPRRQRLDRGPYAGYLLAPDR